MLWLAIVIFVALAIAVLRGGRLVNLGDIELKAWWLLLIALGLQIGTRLLPKEDWAESVGVAMVLRLLRPSHGDGAAQPHEAGDVDRRARGPDELHRDRR